MSSMRRFACGFGVSGLGFRVQGLGECVAYGALRVGLGFRV
jgi:hypothetical protein